MGEGGNGSLDQPSTSQYEPKPVPADKIAWLTGEMNRNGYTDGISAAVSHLRHSDGVLGKRIAFGLEGKPDSVNDAFLETGNMITLASEGGLRSIRTPDDLKHTDFYPVQGFDPDEIGRLQSTMSARGEEFMTKPDTRFIGYLDVTGEADATLGVIDTLNHTRTEFPFEDPYA